MCRRDRPRLRRRYRRRRYRQRCDRSCDRLTDRCGRRLRGTARGPIARRRWWDRPVPGRSGSYNPTRAFQSSADPMSEIPSGTAPHRPVAGGGIPALRNTCRRRLCPGHRGRGFARSSRRFHRFLARLTPVWYSHREARFAVRIARTYRHFRSGRSASSVRSRLLLRRQFQMCRATNRSIRPRRGHILLYLRRACDRRICGRIPLRLSRRSNRRRVWACPFFPGSWVRVPAPEA